MTFKAQKLIVNDSNPFENDQLSRKSEVENLAELLINISTPIVLSVNAPWGYGKTTFLKMLHSTLKTRKQKAIYFSAWETDFASDPLLAFIGEINDKLDSIIGSDKIKNEAWKKAKNASAYIIKKSIPSIIKLATYGAIDTEEIFEDEASSLMENFSKDLIQTYSENKNAIFEFKKSIKSMISDDEKLYIFIDELDRCRPTYAIELLERIKHLLDIDGLVMILAMDKTQLSHSIKSIYGSGFEAIGYLRRFIDIEYNLSNKNIDNFIEKLYDDFNFDSFFSKRMQYQSLAYDKEHLINTFKLLAKHKNLSLRETEQIFSKLNLVIRATEKNVYLFPALVVFLLIVKEFHSEIYNKYINESPGCDEIIKLLYEMIPQKIRLDSFECMLIEGLLISPKLERHSRDQNNLLSRHEAILANQDLTHPEREYSDRVITIAQRPNSDIRGCVPLKSIISRIEMIENFKFSSKES